MNRTHPAMDANTKSLHLLAHAKAILFLLMEPQFADEIPSNAAIESLHDSIEAHLREIVGPDAEYALNLKDGPFGPA